MLPTDVPVHLDPPPADTLPPPALRRARTWTGVVTEFTAADCERVRRAFAARRVATRIVGTRICTWSVVVLADKVSAATLSRERMRVHVTWEHQGDGLPAYSHPGYRAKP
jgi:hypothetical protein